jgi:hypothetical protein
MIFFSFFLGVKKTLSYSFVLFFQKLKLLVFIFWVFFHTNSWFFVLELLKTYGFGDRVVSSSISS